jgi:hypothetical protein
VRFHYQFTAGDNKSHDWHYSADEFVSKALKRLGFRLTRAKTLKANAIVVRMSEYWGVVRVLASEEAARIKKELGGDRSSMTETGLAEELYREVSSFCWDFAFNALCRGQDISFSP